MKVRRNKYFVFYSENNSISSFREIDKDEFEFATKNPQFLCELRDSEKEYEYCEKGNYCEKKYHFRHKIFDICYVHMQTKKGYSF